MDKRPRRLNEKHKIMLKIILASLVLFSIAACTAPTRSDPSAFSLIQRGKIQKSDIQDFTACVMDGFGESHFILTNITVRQQRRTNGYRVEALTNSALLISADILDSGQVELFESTTAALINTSGERETFSACLERFGVPN